MYQDNFFNELIIDNFAGGGGASVGIELAVGRPVDIAVNHDADAIAMHKVNHPYTRHYQEDVFAVEPEKVTGGRPVGIAWFSPDCTHFSRAKGDKPVERKRRGLAWVILRWCASSAAPRVFFMENVEEFMTWGPVIEQVKKVKVKKYLKDERGKYLKDDKGKRKYTYVEEERLVCFPDTERAGETFDGFIRMLTTGIEPEHPALKEACEFLNLSHGSEGEAKLIKGLGYNVDYRVSRACDDGAPTIRKRFTLVGRRDGKPVVWPEATHGSGKGKKPYRTAAECIDWTIPCPSIFNRKRPLVENTLRRIARGLDKFVIKNPKPYILEMNFNNSFQDVDKPMSTQTTANHHYLVTPEIVECSHKSGSGIHSAKQPLNTQTGKACFGLSTPYLTKFQQHSLGQSPVVPLDTVMAGATRFGAVLPTIIQYHSEQSKGETRGQDVKEPLLTVDAAPRYALTSCFISKYFSGEGNKASGVDTPLPTVTARDHNSVIAPHLVHYYGGADHASDVRSPIPTVTVEPRHYLTAHNLCVLRKNMDGKAIDEPIPTLTTSPGHFAEIRTYVMPVEEGVDTKNWAKVRTLLNKYAGYNLADNEILIIEIKGVAHFIADIGMRMLKAEELKLAQGFPYDYVIDIEKYIGKKYSEAKQIARLGNAVCPPVATALVRANCPELCYKRPLRTVAELESVYARSVV